MSMERYWSGLLPCNQVLFAVLVLVNMGDFGLWGRTRMMYLVFVFFFLIAKTYSYILNEIGL